MIIRDTVLIPALQYVLKNIEEESMESARTHIEAFRSIQIPCDEDENNTVSKALDEILEWMSLYAEDSDSARNSLDEKLNREKGCDSCLVCRDCFKVFWIEVYNYFYSDSKYEKRLTEIRKGNLYDFHALPESLRRHIDTKTSASDYYWERCKALKKIKSFQNRLVMLKGLSSSTPAVMNGAFNTDTYTGGGIYLNWDGFGIVIDPGYHFIEAMHNSGLSVLDVDAVVITHEHIDHSNDMRVLDDLNYSLHRYGKEHHCISWYLDGITYRIAQQFRITGSGFAKETSQLYCIDPEKQTAVDENMTEMNISEGIPLLYKPGNAEIVLRVVPTLHEKKNNDYLRHTFGCSFLLVKDLLQRKLFYTSDTAYGKEIGGLSEGADLVIANISSVYEEDLLRANAKKTHLGYMGCFNLLEAMKENPPSLFLLSEFWNAKSDIRFDISKYLSEEIKKNFLSDSKLRIVPTEVGMQVDLKTLRVQCSCCHNFTGEFIVAKPTQEYEKIKYICKECYFE